jgi:hypothetical protein
LVNRAVLERDRFELQRGGTDVRHGLLRWDDVASEQKQAAASDQVLENVVFEWVHKGSRVTVTMFTICALTPCTASKSLDFPETQDQIQ